VGAGTGEGLDPMRGGGDPKGKRTFGEEGEEACPRQAGGKRAGVKSYDFKGDAQGGRKKRPGAKETTAQGKKNHKQLNKEELNALGGPEGKLTIKKSYRGESHRGPEKGGKFGGLAG